MVESDLSDFEVVNENATECRQECLDTTISSVADLSIVDSTEPQDLQLQMNGMSVALQTPANQPEKQKHQEQEPMIVEQSQETEKQRRDKQEDPQNRSEPCTLAVLVHHQQQQASTPTTQPRDWHASVTPDLRTDMVGKLVKTQRIVLPDNRWQPDACSKNLLFTQDNLAAISRPIGEFACGRALTLQPIPKERHGGDAFFYFEIMCARIAKKTVGFGVCVVHSKCSTTEYKFYSHGELYRHTFLMDETSGKITAEAHYLDKQEEQKGFGPGDIVGCGFDLATHALFFTRNGIQLGVTAHVADLHDWEDVFPVVRLRSMDDAVIANFGKSEFAFKNE